MKEYYIGHSGFYGPPDKPYIKVPDGAIILDYHVEEKEYEGEKWLGLFKTTIRTRKKGVRYLVLKVDSKEDGSQ